MNPNLRAYVENEDGSGFIVENNIWTFMINQSIDNKIRLHDHMIILETNIENIMQSTNMYDSNENEIYECDFIQYHDSIYEVIQSPSGTWYIMNKNNAEALYRINNDIKIIGNSFIDNDLFKHVWGSKDNRNIFSKQSI